MAKHSIWHYTNERVKFPTVEQKAPSDASENYLQEH